MAAHDEDTPPTALAARRAEDALRRSEERYRALAAASSQAVWSWSPTGDVGDFAGAQGWWQELTGQPPHSQGAELTGWLDVVHPDDQPTSSAAWQASIATGATYDTEYRVRARAGGWRHVRARGVPVRGPDGAVREWVGTLDDVTDARRAEAARRESEDRLRTLADNLPAGFIYQIVHAADDSRRFSYVSGGVEAACGASPAEVLADPIRLYGRIVEEDQPRVRAAEEAALREHRQFDCQFRMRGPDGRERWLHCRSAPRPLPGGGTVWDGVALDVTARRLAEDAVRRNEALLQTVIDSSPALISFVDRDLRYRFVNRAYEEWFGVAPDRIVGRTTRELLGDAAFEQRRPYLEAALAGETLRFEGPTEHPALGTRQTEVIYLPHRTEDGEVDGIFVHVHDITDQQRAAQGARDSEERLRLAVEIARMGTFEIDLRTDAVEVNESGRAIYGWPSTRTTFAAVQAHFHPDDRDDVLREVGAALDPAGPGEFEVEQRVYRTDGALRWIRVRGRATFEGAGPDRRAVRLLGAYLDVTDRRQMEDSLREADRKKDDFIALLAHELRNPLAPIRNGLQVMRLAAGDAAAVAKSRDMMDRQLGHMVRLIDDLLDVSRISRNKMELRRERVLLADVVGAAVETARPLIDAAGHRLDVSLPTDPVFLDADLTRLAQVFGNLLTNSAKYTPRGGRIRLAAAHADGAATVTVRDDGAGIPADALPTIFDMFSQVDRSLERSSGGLGIGLALVKGLVEMHGGEVTAASDGPDTGSTFTVRLPTLASPAAAASDGPAADAGRPAAPARRVLVVDDNRDSADSMAMMLQLLGDDVAVAHDGVEAVEAAERFRPELILMDVGMPRLNGLDATRRIRERPWGRAVAIVALTGWGQEADRALSRDAGCDGHLVKPVSLTDLDALLQKLAGTPAAAQS